MANLGLSKEDCIYYLQSYSNEIDAILVLFDNRGYPLDGQTKIVQDRLSKLKLSLKQDYRIRASKKGGMRMSMYEEITFYPAIHKAHANINVAANSQPTVQWVVQLVDAQFTIQSYMNSLQAIIDREECLD